MSATKGDFSNLVLDFKIMVRHLKLYIKRLEKLESSIDFDEVPENDGCEKRDSWPHAIFERLVTA